MKIQPADTKKRNSADTKNRILKTALKVFVKNGYEGTTTREICRKANININLIYYYFGGKQGLYDALIEEIFEKQRQSINNSGLQSSADISSLGRSGQIELLYTLANTLVDFLYAGLSEEEFALFLQAQQRNGGVPGPPPAFPFAAKILAEIFPGKDHRDIVFEVMFFVGQVVFPRIASMFLLKLIGQKKFTDEDVNIVKNHMRSYLNVMLQEKGD